MLTPGGMFNPTSSTLCCPDQTDFLIFKTKHGFCAVMLDLVEGIQGGEDNSTGVHLVNDNWYESTESVPELIARFAEVKKLRYSKERAETERIGSGNAKPIVPSGEARKIEPAALQQAGVWKKP